MTPNILEKAVRIAVRAHQGQMRKEGGVPYVTHPVMAALKLAQHGFSETVLAAALVHDVLEDTSLSAADLRDSLGSEVLAIVTALSEDKSLPWEERKQRYIDAVRAAAFPVKAVSIADKIHNLESLYAAYQEHGSALWSRFSRGREQKLWFEQEMLRMFEETWDHPLIEEYASLVQRMRSLH